MKELNNWKKFLDIEFEKEYFKNLEKFLLNKDFYPNKKDIFKCFELTDLFDIKVVILGQDPYHNENEAHGLCFSVYESIKTPPSLKNIFKELEGDLNIKRENSDLSDWAKQGVFLLNTVLTVEKNKPFSHRNKGWEIFTDNIIKIINENCNNVVFVLWGNAAKEKEALINNKHLIIKSSHPSPFSYNKGFKGSKSFSKINNYLKKHDKNEIIW
jgi:uracil-DNA glycosylase